MPSSSAISSTRDAMTSLATLRFLSGNARFWRTVIVSYKTGNWKTWATLRFAVSKSVTSTPSKYTRPTDGVSNPEMMLRSVVLPQPDGPSSATALPSFQVSEIGLSANVAPPSYEWPTFSKRISAISAPPLEQRVLLRSLDQSHRQRCDLERQSSLNQM